MAIERSADDHRGTQQWKIVEDLRPHLDPLVEELGRMPTNSELRLRKCWALAYAISQFGGFPKVAEVLGYLYTGPRSWMSVEDLRPQLQPLVNALGHMPSVNDLRVFKRDDLLGPIIKYGGFPKVAEALGYVSFQVWLQQWTSVESLRQVLQPIVEELGRMPLEDDLCAYRRRDLVPAIRKLGGYRKIAQTLHYPYEETTPWGSVEDLRPHLQPLVNELGYMPSQTDLEARELKVLAEAIRRKFGGHQKVAKQLGYVNSRNRSKVWPAVEDLRPHLDPLVKELGRMPTNAELRTLKRGDLTKAIGKFGGYGEVAKALGYYYTGGQNWKQVEDLRPHLQPIVDELGHMPSISELRMYNRLDLPGPISKFGGFHEVAGVLGYPHTESRRWASVEDLRPYLQSLVDKLGHMPTRNELRELSQSYLENAIQKFGGTAEVARLLGYPYSPRHSWDSVEDLRQHLEPFVDQLGHMPSQAYLAAHDRADLADAVNKFGGFPVVADVLGFPYRGPLRTRPSRLRVLEVALLRLHESQHLSPGQIMLVLRHAGLLSARVSRHMLQRLHAPPEPAPDTLASSNEINEGERMQDDVDEEGWSLQAHDQEGQWSIQRDRKSEVMELRGWSAVGNLLDPTPALVQLSVTRLKTAFYRFAHELRGTLSVPRERCSPEDIERLKRELWDAAFGEYGDLIDNDLIRTACQTYITDLEEALLLPHVETIKTPRLYQLDGARFLAQRLRSETRPYGLLFDQPGMGKTLMSLWALAAAGIERFIIVAPLTVKSEVWTLAELRIAYPHLAEPCVARSIEAALYLPKAGPAVVILHYEELRQHEIIKQLSLASPGGLPFEVLVFDEAHTVKERLASGPSEQREGAWLLRKAARACIGLTATPVVNELYEPVSLLHLVQGQKETQAGRQLQSKRLRDRVDILEYLLTDSLRRLKPDVLFEIPPRVIEPCAITPKAEQLEHIQHFLSRGRRAVGKALAEYRRLMFDIKLDWIADRVRDHMAALTADGQPDPKVLILCYNVEGVSKAVYARLLSAFGQECVAHIDGTTSQDQRKAIVERFRMPAATPTSLDVLVGTVGTIGVGITLFDAEAPVTPHRVIFADLPFTWAEFEQGVDRLHRVGQRRIVQVDVPLVSYGEQLTRTDGGPVRSFDEDVWAWICQKQVLSDQVLDAEFDISEYKDTAIRRAIAQTLRSIENSGGAVFAPPPPAESSQAAHRRLQGRYRALSRHQAAALFRESGASERFLQLNDASLSAKLAQKLVRERLARWLDKRSIVVDLGCGSNPLHDLPCAQIIGIDRHGVNGGLIGDSAETGLPSGEADFVVFSLSMWGTPQDRLSYLREAKRLLRPIGKLIIVEPAQTFGGPQVWEKGVARLKSVLEQLELQLASASEHLVDTGTRLVAIVASNSNDVAIESIDPNSCTWAE